MRNRMPAVVLVPVGWYEEASAALTAQKGPLTAQKRRDQHVS
jgi:hypothetical protein